jgi:hypothetical protein
VRRPGAGRRIDGPRALLRAARPRAKRGTPGCPRESVLRTFHLSTDDLLHSAGLERHPSFWSKALPIAAGVGAGVVAGFAVTAALLTPSRRDRLASGEKGLLRRRHAEDEPELHSDAPGSDTSRTLHGKDSAVRASNRFSRRRAAVPAWAAARRLFFAPDHRAAADLVLR